MFTALGEAYKFMGVEVPFAAKDYRFGKRLMSLAGELVAEGRVKPLPMEKKEGGLEGLIAG